MMKKIALLCDYGLDDAIATLYLLKQAEEFENIDILPIAGNMPLEIAHSNAKRLLGNMESLPENVRIVDTSSVKQNGEAITEIHGNDGMGDILPPEVNYMGGVMKYEDWIKQADSSYTIVSLGPCTLTADIIKRIDGVSLVLMGGNISQPPNYKGYEFNHGMDTDAFAESVKHNHVIATLDTCHNEHCDFYKIKIKEGGLFADLVKRSAEMSRERKEETGYIYDLVAAVYLMHPEKFTTEIKTDPYGNTMNVLKYVDEKDLI